VLFSHRQRRSVTWFALVAMLALALMPTLSHAMAQARGNSVFDEICSASGTRSPQPGDPAQGMAFGHLEHCPFCHLQAQPLAPPPAAQPLPAQPFVHEQPPLFLAAARTLYAWRSSQPRGPPSLS
jgi:hypothetical protein